ncbi:CPBP family intramembrane glutamic endopeptidase [Dictyobacter kobayashii]|uniref:CAAX prenyl protease 2/Lysostaphin resistance protein A-like domain-containing protein n=1 Tax=Dictyobacter kobayashii TaxID=2014872 RepID=A0A402AJR1_9CHLR|nr:CPBP family intramembrane glutamic endopeptidase [Dictyobacter kobayashii]GCE19361.1 hypothetical protein KDK_31610 [Dictyobacter kobayashii]
MSNVALILSSLFTLYIGIVRPLLSRRRYQKFKEAVVNHPTLRTRYYRRILVEPWLWLVVIGIILQLDSAPLSVLGLKTPDDWTLTILLIAEVVILLIIVHAVLLYRMKKTQRPAMAAALILKIKELLPHTAQERSLWLFISITAGICEEITFRGFLLVYFLAISNFFGLQIPLAEAAFLSSVLFGFAHIYQGWKGVLGTGLLGAIFAYLYISTGSLILPIIIHILIDARIVFLVPALLKLDQPKKD